MCVIIRFEQSFFFGRFHPLYSFYIPTMPPVHFDNALVRRTRRLEVYLPIVNRTIRLNKRAGKETVFCSEGTEAESCLLFEKVHAK